MSGATSSAAQPRFALAAIDIDDTLVGPDGVISAENAAAVARLVAEGTRVVLASGRSHANMLPFHRALGLPPGPVISAQGAVVQDSETGAVRLAYPIPPSDVVAVTRDGRERGFTVQHYRSTGIYVETRSRWSEYDQSRNSEPHRLIPDLLATGERGEVAYDVAKIIWLGNPDVVDSATAEARARYGARLTITRTDPPYLEFSPLNVDKSTALAAVAAELGVERARVLAFGDGNNDAAMLAWAGVGVAMPHAKSAARDAADHVGPDGDPETALARAVELVLS
ncbi:MAG TPA: Cof-type HAD-IIB family hydrolase [Gemmatimonadaceae bacterium]|jgi:Cof subfamily protein (haloacid dehalogenase superfamily)|nr:Cof-type HAD-IIB family hydrolase [Gemmatimonadaceae bacterium]